MKLRAMTLAFAFAAFTWSLWATTEEDHRPDSEPQQLDSDKAQSPPRNSLIDFDGFLGLTTDLQAVRDSRRVPIDEFLKMAKMPNTMILDTRSKAAFDRIHLAGAVHLNFSDFTAQKLAQVIPSKATRILIYCNNNFVIESRSPAGVNLETAQAALATKVAPLALNIPTFINLYGYGYENVYELADALPLDDPRLTFAESIATADTNAAKLIFE